jgi:4-diphosphocytidyl-2-C-methyl-D-erythritol kinase
MTFADVGDELAASPADSMELVLTGPFGGDLAHEADNLVARARDALLDTVPRPPAPFRLTLAKGLPIAAGLGGGSADAAAALRLVRRAFVPEISDKLVGAIARALGADVYACLLGQPTMASGRGEALSPAPGLPDLHIVLANPRVPSPTGDVYRAYDLAPATADAPHGPHSIASAIEAVAYLSARRNDLEAPAVRLRPQIGEVLSALAAQPETLLARMSGSGATCFAVCVDFAAATALAARLSRHEPNWWVRRTVLKGRATS